MTMTTIIIKTQTFTEEMNTDNKYILKHNFTGSYYQNIYNENIRKDDLSGKPYYMLAVRFLTQNTDCNGKRLEGAYPVFLNENRNLELTKHFYIREFPFEPKTFDVEVVEKEYRKLEDGSYIEEIGGGSVLTYIFNTSDLDKVIEYYDV